MQGVDMGRGNSLLFTFFVVLALTRCGKEQPTGPTPAAQPMAKILSAVSASENLAKDWKGRGVSVDEMCLRLTQLSQELPRLEVYSSRCDSVTSSTSKLSYEARELIDPEKVETPTGVYVLYEQLLPVGELKKDGDKVELVDLCTLDPMYLSACKIKIDRNRVAGLQLNESVVLERVRAEKKLREENRSLRSEIDKNRSAISSLNRDLQSLSGQIQSEKEAAKTILTSFEPILAQEEKRLTLLLKGMNGMNGLEKSLIENVGQIRETTENLAKVQAELQALQKSYVEKQARLKEEENGLDKLLTERLALKQKIQTATEEEKLKELNASLAALLTQITDQVVKISDTKAELTKDLAALKADPKSIEESTILKSLGGLKSRNTELQQKFGLASDKMRAVQLAKNHLATANKFLAQDKLREVVILLPLLGKFFEQVAANPI